MLPPVVTQWFGVPKVCEDALYARQRESERVRERLRERRRETGRNRERGRERENEREYVG